MGVDVIATLCPAMQGYGQMRCAPLSQLIETVPFSNCFISLELGSLRWAYSERDEKPPISCGYLVSKVHTKENSTFSKSKAIGKSSTPAQSLSIQVITKEGTYQLDLSLPLPVASLWHSALDLHFSHCSRPLAALPQYAFEDLDSFPAAFDISTKMTLVVHDREHELLLSLLDDTDVLSTSILETHGLDDGHKLSIENSLLVEQRHLSADLFSLYRKAERETHRLQQRCLLLTHRVKRAEEHASVLASHLESIEKLAPQLAMKLEASSSSSSSIPAPEPQTCPSPPPSRGRHRSRSPPSFAMPTAASAQDNLHHRLEEVQRQLDQTRRELSRTKARLQHEHLANQTHVRQGVHDHLAAENQRLRSWSVEIRTEVADVHRQLREIQTAALQTVETLHNTLPGQVPGKDSAVERPVGVRGTKPRRPSLWLAPPVQRGEDDDRDEDGDGREGEGYSQLDEQLPAGGEPSPAQEGDGDYPLALVEGWTLAYAQVIPAPVHDLRARRRMQMAVHALRWAAVEQRLLSNLFAHYSTVSKGGLTLTRFMRMMKDLSLLSGQSTTSRPEEPTVHTSHTSSLTYSELSMIFTHAGRLPVEDLPRKPQAFRVAHHPTTSRRGPSSSQTLSSAHCNAAGVRSVLTRAQFIEALQRVADQAFSRLVRHAAGEDMHTLPPGEVSRVRRACMELLLVQVVVPSVIAHGLCPWALVYLQDVVQAVTRDDSVAIQLRHRLPVVVAVFRRYSHVLHGVKDDDHKAGGGLPRRPHVVRYRDVSKWARDYGLVPFLIDEQQLFEVFHEVWQADRLEAVGFPCMALPRTLLEALARAMDDVWREEGVIQWTMHQQQAVLGAQMLALGLGTAAAGVADRKEAAAGDAGQDEIYLPQFVVLLCVIAAQQEEAATPTLLEKLEKFFDMLENRHHSLLHK